LSIARGNIVLIYSSK